MTRRKWRWHPSWCMSVVWRRCQAWFVWMVSAMHGHGTPAKLTASRAEWLRNADKKLDDREGLGSFGNRMLYEHRKRLQSERWCGWLQQVWTSMQKTKRNSLQQSRSSWRWQSVHMATNGLASAYMYIYMYISAMVEPQAISKPSDAPGERMAWGMMWHNRCRWILHRDRPLSEKVLRIALLELIKGIRALH